MLDAYKLYNQVPLYFIAPAYAIYACFKLPPDWFWWPVASAVILYASLSYVRTGKRVRLEEVPFGIGLAVVFTVLAIAIDGASIPGMSMAIASAIWTAVFVGTDERFRFLTVKQRLYKCMAFFPVAGAFAVIVGVVMPLPISVQLGATIALIVIMMIAQRCLLDHAKRTWPRVMLA